MNAGRIIAGAVVALAAGAALGVLFAPDKGSNTRKKLSQQGSRYIGTLKNTASEFADTLEETYDSAKGTAVGIADRVKEEIPVPGVS